MHEKLEKRTIVFWAEQPMIFARWNGGVDIKQEGNTIYVTDDNMKEFIKVLQEAFKIVVE